MSWHSVEHLALIGLTYGGRPFWLFLALTMALTIVALALKRAAIVVSLPPALRVIGAVTAIAGYAAIAIWYLLLDGFYDHAEPSIAAVAWLFQIGKPIYHAADAAERYSHIYGPFAFMIPGSSLSWLGTGLQQAKLPGTAAGLLTIAIVYRLARSSATRRSALVLAAVVAIVALAFRNRSFWIRPDSYLMFLSAVTLLGATARRPLAGSLVVGIAVGVMADLKLTGPLYALPALGIVIATSGWRWMPIVAVSALAIAIWPFFVFDNVSWQNFWHWFEVSARNGLRFRTLRANIEWALFVVVPVIPLLAAPLGDRLRRIRAGGLCGLVLAMIAVIIAASKPGAGPDHVLPFLPAVFYFVSLYIERLPAHAREHPTARVAAPAFVLTALVAAASEQVFFLATSAEVNGMRLSSELASFVDAHPNRTVAMGFTRGGEHLGHARPVLVFRTGAYPLDSAAIQEYQMSGLDLPEATIRALENCETEFWLFPKDRVPFSGRNVYPVMERRPLVPDTFRQTFGERYERVEDTRHFQVWRCRPGIRGTD
jgi:Dolichyl-phosphate-mannose-protein mannosyltransferase